MGLKGDQQRIKIIESASYCLAHFGERGTTFQAISEHCHLSQASVVKYLKNRENIFPTVLDYWITRARETTEQAISKTATPEQKLRSYFQISRDLFFEKHEVSMTILILQSLAGFDEKYRVINSQIREIAQDRIAEIIEAGIADGSFKKVKAKVIAKTMHNCLMGYLLSSVTETKKPSDLPLLETLEDMCVNLVMREPSRQTKI